MTKEVKQTNNETYIRIFPLFDILYLLVCDDANKKRFLFVFNKTGLGTSDIIPLKIVDTHTFKYFEFDVCVGEYEKAFGDSEEVAFAQKYILKFEKETNKKDLTLIHDEIALNSKAEKQNNNELLKKYKNEKIKKK